MLLQVQHLSQIKKQEKVANENESDLATIFELIAQMNKKLDQLDHIEQHLVWLDEKKKNSQAVLHSRL